MGLKAKYVIIILSIISIVTWLAMLVLIVFGDLQTDLQARGALIFEGSLLTNLIVFLWLAMWHDLYEEIDED